MATSLLAHLYSGEGLSNEKKKNMLDILQEVKSRFLAVTQSDELTAVLKEHLLIFFKFSRRLIYITFTIQKE